MKKIALLVLIFLLVSTVSVTAVEEADLIIVGAGGAGLTAAIAAHDAGVDDVILLEKMAFAGGATLISGARTSAAETNLQANAGIEDSAEEFFLDLMHGGGYTNDARLTWLMAEEGGQTINWLEDLGAEFKMDTINFAEHRNSRTYQWVGGGPAFINALVAAVEERGIKIYTNTEAVQLTKREGKIDGVIAINENGNKELFNAQTVIMATGGFGANKDMRPMDGILYYGPVSSTGDGHKMAEDMGAELRFMDHMKVYPQGVEVAPGQAQLTTFASNELVSMGAVYVNSSGERVMDETKDLVSIKKKTLAQPDKQLFIVFDQAMKDKMDSALVFNTSDETIEEYIQEPGRIARFDELAEAADAMGIDPQKLSTTIEEYNQYVEQGEDPKFERSNLNQKIEEGPFYIMEQKPRTATSLGGLNVALDMKVLDKEQNPIPGLYAAGEIIGAAHGDESMPGVCTLWAFVSGKKAGEEAALELME